MKVGILVIGRMRRGPEADLVAHYLDRARRAGPSVGLTEFTEHDFDESRARSVKQRKADEAERLLERVGPSLIIALDETGKALTSQAFADWIGERRDAGVPALTCLIGGPDGHDAAVRARADLVLSLSAMTLPHLLARLVLAEQLYRAVTILANHPYHRA